jgi:hypothetical protein
VPALEAKSVPNSAAPTNAADKSGQANTEAAPLARTEPVEEGLTEEAHEIARLFGLPITNSVVVPTGRAPVWAPPRTGISHVGFRWVIPPNMRERTGR